MSDTNTITTNTVRMFQVVHINGFPQWEAYHMAAGEVAKAFGVTEEEAVDYFHGRSPQAGREAMRQHRENIERARISDRWVALATNAHGEYRRYLLERAGGS